MHFAKFKGTSILDNLRPWVEEQLQLSSPVTWSHMVIAPSGSGILFMPGNCLVVSIPHTWVSSEPHQYTSPPWSEVFTKVLSYHQEHTRTLLHRVYILLYTESPCHPLYFRVPSWTHHWLWYYCWRDSKGEPISIKDHGNKSNWGSILKPIGNKRNNPHGLYTCSFSSNCRYGTLHSCVTFPTLWLISYRFCSSQKFPHFMVQFAPISASKKNNISNFRGFI